MQWFFFFFWKLGSSNRTVCTSHSPRKMADQVQLVNDEGGNHHGTATFGVRQCDNNTLLHRLDLPRCLFAAVRIGCSVFFRRCPVFSLKMNKGYPVSGHYCLFLSVFLKTFFFILSSDVPGILLEVNSKKQPCILLIFFFFHRKYASCFLADCVLLLDTTNIQYIFIYIFFLILYILCEGRAHPGRSLTSKSGTYGFVKYCNLLL